jgi:hypothetical protein
VLIGIALLGAVAVALLPRKQVVLDEKLRDTR